MTQKERRARLLSLMERYCQLGRLLDPDVTIEDGTLAIAKTELILSEMANTQAEIDGLVAKQN